MKRLLLGSAALAVAASLTVGLSSGLAATRSAGRATVAVGSTSLGLITATRLSTGDSGSARQIQMAVKLLF